MYTANLTRPQLARIIAHVEFTSKDTSLPVLNGVHIVAEGDKITVSSTDRYVLAESTLEIEGAEGETASAIIPASDITNWKNIAKLSQTFRLTLGNTWELDTGTSKATGMTVNAEYPKIDRLFPEDRLLHPITPTGLSVTNLDKLGKFARAAGVPISERVWRIGAARPEGSRAPIIALIEGTRALIMPVTGPNAAETAPEGYRYAPSTN